MSRYCRRWRFDRSFFLPLEGRLLLSGSPADTTELTLVLRGQSNADLFTYYGEMADARNMAQQLLGYDGTAHKINLVADYSNPTNNTIYSGTALIGDWMAQNPDGSWSNKSLESGLLADLASKPADVLAAPAAVVWLHSEYDSANSSLTTAQWVSAVTADAAQVRSVFGANAAKVPYLFVNAIPYSQASTSGINAIKAGMQQLADDPTFNAKIAAQIDDTDMNAWYPTYGGPNMNTDDAKLLATRLAYSIADTFSWYALPGSPLVLAGGHVDQLGPQGIQASTTAYPTQLLLTVAQDSATALQTLSANAAGGLGWSLNGSNTTIKATAAQIVDNTHILLTFSQAVPTNGSVSLNYAYGYGRLAPPADTSNPNGYSGHGNAVYDSNAMPIWTVASGVSINSGPQTPETSKIHGTSTWSGSTTTPTIVTAPAATPSPVTEPTAALTVLGADAGSPGEPGLIYLWSVIAAPAGVRTPDFSINGTNGSKNTTVTFYGSGVYSFLVTVSNGAYGASVTLPSVSVVQTPTTIVISPASISVVARSHQRFSASFIDQFNNPIASSPAMTWSVVSGLGSIDPVTGLFTSPATTGTTTIKVVSGSASQTATVKTVATTGLPQTWLDADIGGTTPTGSATFDGTTYTVKGGGTDIFNCNDVFNLAYGSVAGDQVLYGRITSLSNTDPWAKGGVMFRNTTGPDSMYAAVLGTPSKGVSFIWRAGTTNMSKITTISSVQIPSATTPL